MLNIGDISCYIIDLFNQKNDPHLFYHNLTHTLSVVNKVELMLENDEDVHKSLAIAAAWFHDVGYLFSYNDHEDVSIEICSKFFKEIYRGNISKEDIDFINRLIEVTKSDVLPASINEKIMVDADMCYSVCGDFKFLGDSLRKEWVYKLNKYFTDDEWNMLQLNFITDFKFQSEVAEIFFGKKLNENIRIYTKKER